MEKTVREREREKMDGKKGLKDNESEIAALP